MGFVALGFQNLPFTRDAIKTQRHPARRYQNKIKRKKKILIFKTYIQLLQSLLFSVGLTGVSTLLFLFLAILYPCRALGDFPSLWSTGNIGVAQAAAPRPGEPPDHPIPMDFRGSAQTFYTKLNNFCTQHAAPSLGQSVERDKLGKGH